MEVFKCSCVLAGTFTQCFLNDPSEFPNNSFQLWIPVHLSPNSFWDPGSGWISGIAALMGVPYGPDGWEKTLSFSGKDSGRQTDRMDLCTGTWDAWDTDCGSGLGWWSWLSLSKTDHLKSAGHEAQGKPAWRQTPFFTFPVQDGQRSDLPREKKVKRGQVGWQELTAPSQGPWCSPCSRWSELSCFIF